MGVLKIKVKKEYKSFPTEFVTNLEGELIIVSGVNGSGKSQFLEIIKGHESNNQDKKIESEIFLDGNLIKEANIIYRSFQSNIHQVHNIGNAEAQRIVNHKNNVWNNYTNGILLNPNNQNLRNNRKSVTEARNILITAFGEENVNSGTLKKEQVIDSIPDDFIWESDDIFTNIVADSFLVYASKVNELKVQAHDRKLDYMTDVDIEKKLGVPPWKELNGLFELLRIDYRFSDNYCLKGLSINEQPRLYPIINGAIDKTNPREVKDLSDGEKVITSLVFSILNSISDIKLILLDEFDATFNPSLTEGFYKILDRYFIQEGIMVIVVTHSPTTISLAPENTSFYEVFKKGNSERVVSVQKEQYNELKVANKAFYDKIGNQQLRISELINEKRILEEIKGTNSIILVEDKYDQIYKIAWLKLNKIECNIVNFEEKFNESAPFSIYGGLAAGGVSGFLRMKNISMHKGKNIIGIFDFDKDGFENFYHLKKDVFWEDEISGSKCECHFKKRTDHENCYALLLPIPSYLEELADIRHKNFSNYVEIENLLPEKFLLENKLVTEEIIAGKTYLKVKDEKKKGLWKLLFELSLEDFENFRPLFKKIESISKPTEISSR